VNPIRRAAIYTSGGAAPFRPRYCDGTAALGKNLDSLPTRDSQLATAARSLGFEVMGTQQKEERLAATIDW
jgi:hypothetical protein